MRPEFCPTNEAPWPELLAWFEVSTAPSDSGVLVIVQKHVQVYYQSISWLTIILVGDRPRGRRCQRLLGKGNCPTSRSAFREGFNRETEYRC